MLPANKFLWNDVDIWCVRYYYFFGRVPVLRKLQAKGAQVWWYPVLQLVGRQAAQLRDRQVAGRRARLGLAHVPVERRRHALLGRQPVGQRAAPARATATPTRTRCRSSTPTGASPTARPASSTPATTRATGWTTRALRRSRRCASKRCATAFRTSSTCASRAKTPGITPAAISNGRQERHLVSVPDHLRPHLQLPEVRDFACRPSTLLAPRSPP